MRLRFIEGSITDLDFDTDKSISLKKITCQAYVEVEKDKDGNQKRNDEK